MVLSLTSERLKRDARLQVRAFINKKRLRIFSDSRSIAYLYQFYFSEFSLESYRIWISDRLPSDIIVFHNIFESYHSLISFQARKIESVLWRQLRFVSVAFVIFVQRCRCCRLFLKPLPCLPCHVCYR